MTVADTLYAHLVAIADQGGSLPSGEEIARQLNIDSAAISRAFRALAAEGVITHEIHGRQRRVVLRASGRELKTPFWSDQLAPRPADWTVSDALYAVLVELADEGEDLPSNVQLSLKVACTPPSIGLALRQLAETGKITHVSYGRFRRVVLCESGKVLKTPGWQDGMAGRSAPKPREVKMDQASIEALRAPPRRPCHHCGVREDAHDTLGCRTFRVMAA